MEKIKHYFKTYPQSKECFETTDGFLFHRALDARAHAETLENTNVKTWNRHDITRMELAEKEEAEALAKAEAELKAKEEAEAKAKEEAELKAKEEAKALVKAELADQSAPLVMPTEAEVEYVTSVKDESNKKKGKKA